MQAPLGPTQSVLIRGLPLFQGLFYVHKIRSGLYAVSVIQWMSAFQVCPQSKAPLLPQIMVPVSRYRKSLRAASVAKMGLLNRLTVKD